MRTSSRRPRRAPSRRTRLLGERGAAAVEFALVAPVLVLLLLGIVECAKLYQSQGTLAAAAREGVRVMALTNNAGNARSAAVLAARPLSVTTASVAVSRSCAGASATDLVTVTISYRQPFVSGLLGRTGANLTGTASMRCGG